MIITGIGSMGQFHFDSSISDFKYRATKTILRDSLMARLMTEFINVFPMSCCSLLTSEINLYCSRISKIHLLYLVNVLEFCLRVVF